MSEPTAWARYVAYVARTANTSEIAKTTGINQSTVYRWLNDGSEPKPAHAARVAQVYGDHVLRAFVAAGWITEEQAQFAPAAAEQPVEHLTNQGLTRQLDRLILEMSYRLDENYADGRPTEGELAEVHLAFRHMDEETAVAADQSDEAVPDLAARDEDDR